MKLYVLIGGSQHGTVQKMPGDYPAYRFARPRPNPALMEPSESFATFEPLDTETYVVRHFGLKDTQRRMKYLVLEGLLNEEAERLIDEYEASDDTEPPSMAR